MVWWTTKPRRHRPSPRYAAAAIARRTVSRSSPACVAGGLDGKLWAVKQRLDHVPSCAAQLDYILLTDADIVWSGSSDASCRARRERRPRQGLDHGEAALRELRGGYLIPPSSSSSSCCTRSRVRDLSTVPRRGPAAASSHAATARSRRRHRDDRGSLIDDCALGARLKRTGRCGSACRSRFAACAPSDTVADVGRLISRSSLCTAALFAADAGRRILAKTVVFSPPSRSRCSARALRVRLPRWRGS